MEEQILSYLNSKENPQTAITLIRDLSLNEKEACDEIDILSAKGCIRLIDFTSGRGTIGLIAAITPIGKLYLKNLNIKNERLVIDTTKFDEYEDELKEVLNDFNKGIKKDKIFGNQKSEHHVHIHGNQINGNVNQSDLTNDFSINTTIIPTDVQSKNPPIDKPDGWLKKFLIVVVKNIWLILTGILSSIIATYLYIHYFKFV